MVFKITQECLKEIGCTIFDRTRKEIARWPGGARWGCACAEGIAPPDSYRDDFLPARRRTNQYNGRRGSFSSRKKNV